LLVDGFRTVRRFKPVRAMVLRVASAYCNHCVAIIVPDPHAP
jgi:hypothetical protein